MASTALGSESLQSQQPSASTSTASAPTERTPQAGPLPAKVPQLVGEIGYTEYHQEVDLGDGSLDGHGSVEGLNAAEVDARLGRHPADRSYGDLPAQTQTASPIQAPRSPSRAASENPSESNSSLHTVKPPKTSTFFSRKYGGVTVKSILRLALFAFLSAADIVGWVLAALNISKLTGSSNNNQSTTTISPIFLHLIFAIFLLILLIFLERAIFRVRAERYAHVHPGQMLPSSRHRMPIGGYGRSDAIAFAPWNRPPLPTYASALGFRGTGDVEDAIIAAPPPPAYGNTRGSTLLLANLMRSSFRSSRSGQPGNNRESWQMVDSPDLERRASSRSMPVPYDVSEHHEDARRAQRLADTLSQLEEGDRHGRA